ncbi:sensor histidine kinase [Streptosporangium sp. NPDC000396]|uniref:sensor histidine kinase n=1 Tax=Streptosporangium sp. NPDC000396 TaxID=3366185 RepID=UPI0036BABE8A
MSGSEAVMRLRPSESADPGGRRGRWIYLALGYGLLAVPAAWAAALDRLPLPLAGLAALWLPGLILVYPGRRRWLTLAWYAGLLAVATALLTRSDAFALFASLGYPLAFVLFTSLWWSVGAVTATAVITLVAQEGVAGIPATLGIAVPLLFAGWALATESESRRKLIADLTATLEENAGLHAQLLTQAREAGVLDERQRMAREIHDTIAQSLIAIITQLRAADGARDDPARWRRHMDQIDELAGRSLTEARRSVAALRPQPLEGSHLPGALAHLAERWAETSSVQPDLEVTGTARPLATGIEVTLFRVAQEALANIARHAGASRVGITLSYLDDMVLLDVRDDGAGFAEPGEGGFGLDSMRQRVRGVGGTLEIESVPGQGTAVAAAVPAIPAEQEAR